MPGVVNREPRIAVALDTARWDQFESWCARFGPRVGALKVGLEAYLSFGPRAVEVARRHAAAVFLDLKLHDIPNTVAGAVAAAEAMGVDYLTLHASGGPAMLRAAVAAADRVRLLAVTLLTHLGAEDLDRLDLPGSSAARVERLATLAAEAGVFGVVCSPRELEALRRAFAPPFLLVTPGIRPAGTDAGDQKRVATPEVALRAGADLLVVGRPLTRAAEPDAALRQLIASLESQSPPAVARQ